MLGLNKKVYLVELRDRRIKEFDTIEGAEKYAEITAGKVIDKRPKVVPRPKLKQFWERS